MINAKRLDVIERTVQARDLSARRDRTVRILAERPDRMFEGLKLDRDVWQVDLIRRLGGLDGPAPKKVVAACARQVGKSTTLAVFAAWVMMTRGEVVALSAPAFRQSLELAKRIRGYLKRFNVVTVTRDSATDIMLANGGRLIVLPSQGATARGFTVNWLLVDEAGYLSEETDLFEALSPALALADGSIVLSSSPGPCSGTMFSAWNSPHWHKVRVRAAECHRISPEFLESQRELLTPEAYNREYEALFVESGGKLISAESLAACIDSDPNPDWIRFD